MPQRHRHLMPRHEGGSGSGVERNEQQRGTNNGQEGMSGMKAGNKRATSGRHGTSSEQAGNIGTSKQRASGVKVENKQQRQRTFQWNLTCDDLATKTSEHQLPHAYGQVSQPAITAQRGAASDAGKAGKGVGNRRQLGQPTGNNQPGTTSWKQPTGNNQLGTSNRELTRDNQVGNNVKPTGREFIGGKANTAHDMRHAALLQTASGGCNMWAELNGTQAKQPN
ncbi:hypothetical protein K438DRAFT_1790930 [Mycena galopus ATCC 62051]|nr:hypothetical protein K438DRAFT_1790930 [Mycena galopus ATCC 62051]